jgi:hypothetical protein
MKFCTQRLIIEIECEEDIQTVFDAKLITDKEYAQVKNHYRQIPIEEGNENDRKRYDKD